MPTPTMLSHGFSIPVTKEIAYTLCHYVVSPIQLFLLVVLDYERAKFQEKIFLIKFGSKEVVSLIEFIEDQGHILLSSRPFMVKRST